MGALYAKNLRQSTRPMIDSPRPGNVRWQIFAVACATSCILYLHRFSFNFIKPSLEAEHGFSETELAWLYTAFSIGYGLGQIPSGVLGDLFGTRRFLGAVIATWSLLLACIGLTGSYPLLCCVFITFGLAQSGCYPSLARVTREWFPLRIRTTIQGFVATLSGRLGGFLSPIILGTLLIGFCGLGWKSALVVMGGGGVLLCIWFLVVFRSSPESHPRVNRAERELITAGEAVPTGDDAPRLLPFRRVLRNRGALIFLGQQAFSAGADSIYVLHMGDYFLNTLGVDVATAGILIGLPVLGGAIGGGLVGGPLCDWMITATGSRRWGRSTVGFLGKTFAGLLMLLAIGQDSALGAGICLFAVKFFNDWSQPTVWGTITDLGGRYCGTMFGTLNTAGMVGNLVFLPLFGWILDANRTVLIVDGVEKAVENYNPVFLAVAAMYMVSAVSWLFIDCTKSLDREAS